MSDQGGLTDDEASPEEVFPVLNKLQHPTLGQSVVKSQSSTTTALNGQKNAHMSTAKRKAATSGRAAVGQSNTILPAEKVFPIQVGTELFRLSGASISSDGPSYFTQFFEEQIRQNEDSGGVRTLYIDRDPVTFRDIARHLQGYYIKPNDGTHFVRLFADAQFYSLPRLITQLFDSEIFIQIGEEHFQIPKDLFSDPGNSPNFFSLGFAVFFSTPGDVFPGLDKRGLLRPPPINPPHVPSRSSEVFAQLLHLLRGYPLEIRDETHRAQLLRDCRYFHLRGLEQKIIAHDISYNLERKRTEICLRIEDVRPSGISYQAESRETPAQTPQVTVGGGWVYYSRPFVDESPYELIVEIGKESTEIDLDERRAQFHGTAKARVTSLLQVIANKMNLPANVPLGLIMLSGGTPSPASSPGYSALSDDMVKIQFDATSAVTVNGKAFDTRHLFGGPSPTPLFVPDFDADVEISGQNNDGDKSSISPNLSTRSDLPPHKKRKLDENSQSLGKWIVKTGQWRLRVLPTQDPARSGYEVLFVAVKIDAFSLGMHYTCLSPHEYAEALHQKEIIKNTDTSCFDGGKDVLIRNFIRVVLTKMWMVRRRSVWKNVVLFFAYGITFSTLRNTLQSSVVRGRLPDVPEVSFDYGASSYNESKVALLIENRPSGLLAPLLLHFMSVVPPDWKFRFMGTPESVDKVNNSAAIRQHVQMGKIDLTYIPEDLTTSGQEQISGFLTNPRVVEDVLRPAEWLLLFQTDSIICGRHKGSVDDWLEYAWVGAPWYKASRYGGNGGFSLRRVSAMIEVLRHQQRADNSEPEDVWLTERIGHLPGVKTPTGEESMKFSVEQLWHDEPLGYHTGGSGSYLFQSVWAKDSQRQHIYEYCPELKMTLEMDVENMMQVCPAEYIQNVVD